MLLYIIVIDIKLPINTEQTLITIFGDKLTNHSKTLCM